MYESGNTLGCWSSGGLTVLSPLPYYVGTHTEVAFLAQHRGVVLNLLMVFHIASLFLNYMLR